MEPGCEFSEGGGQRWETEAQRERVFSQSELRWYLRGLQNPSDLRVTPGPRQPSALGAGEKRTGVERLWGHGVCGQYPEPTLQANHR